MTEPDPARRILVIEDEALVAMLVEDALLDSGFGVIGPARSVAEALKMLEGESAALGITDVQARAVTYIHMLLPAHNVLWANGVATESFHPANTALSSLDSQDREFLLSRYPDLRFDPYTYGGYARRNLTSPEAAILLRAA